MWPVNVAWLPDKHAKISAETDFTILTLENKVAKDFKTALEVFLMKPVLHIATIE